MSSFKSKHNVNGQYLSCLSINLSKLLASHQISENDLAKNLNIPYNTIKRILTGVTSDPRISTLEQIAEYFGVKLDYLLNKDSSTQSDNDTIAVPILTWDMLSLPEFISEFDRAHWRKWIPVARLENKKELGHLFALESTKSMYPRFPFGTTFIIDSNEQPIDGDLILIRFKSDNSISLRELIIDAPHWQLNAIVSGSKTILFNHTEHSILGIAILTLIQTRSI